MTKKRALFASLVYTIPVMAFLTRATPYTNWSRYSGLGLLASAGIIAIIFWLVQLFFYRGQNEDSTLVADEENKTCQFCFELVKRRALVCRHCRRNISAGLINLKTLVISGLMTMGIFAINQLCAASISSGSDIESSSLIVALREIAVAVRATIHY